MGYGNRVTPVPADYRRKQAEVRAWHQATEWIVRDQAEALRKALDTEGQEQANYVARANHLQGLLDQIGPNPHPSVRA